MATSVLPDVVARASLQEAVPTGVKLRRFAVASVMVLYLASVSPAWFIAPDSALYLMLGENLAQGEGYSHWGVPHVHVPPGYPAFLATMIKLGLGDMFWLNLSAILMSFGLLWFAYKFLAAQVSANQALLLVLCVAFSHELHMAAIHLQSEVLFMLLVWGGLYCYGRGVKERGYWLEAGTLCLIGSCWVRVAGFPLAAAVGCGLLLQPRDVSRRRVWLNSIALASGLGLTFVGFYLYENQVTRLHPVPSYGGYVAGMAQRSSWQWLMRPWQNFLETGREILRLLTGQQHSALGNWAALVWLPIFAGAGVAWRRKHWLGLSAVAGYVLVLMLNVPLLARYLLPVAPLLVWYFLEGVVWFAQLFPRWRWAAPRVAIGFALVLICFNVPRSLVMTYRVQHPQSHRHHQERMAVRDASKFLAAHVRPGERFISNNRQRELAYLSKSWSVPIVPFKFVKSPPPAEEYDAWIDQGMTFFVKWGGLPPQAEPQFEAMRQANGFEPVYRNDFCRIYCSRPLDPLAVASRAIPLAR